MHKYTFALSCLLISTISVSLLMLSVPGIWVDFYGTLMDYGLTITQTIASLTVAHFVFMVILRIYRERKGGRSVGLNWYTNFFKTYPVVDLISATLGVIFTVTSFTVYKGAAIGADGYGFDATFISWDRTILGGYHAWEWTHSVFSTPAATKWIDFLYHPAFFPMIIGFLYCTVSHSYKELRQTYIISYLGSFLIIGMIMANALHSAGPVFDGMLYGDGSTFAPLIDRRAEQLAGEAGPATSALLINYLSTLNQSGEIKMGAGISAMPSMHIVLVLLWLFPAWHLNKYLGIVFTCYTAIIWVGSVHLGWHYFVDGLVSLVVISIIWRAAGHLTGLYGSRGQQLQANVMRATVT